MEQGYIKQYITDYQITFCPVARYDTIQLILPFVSHRFQKIHQLDDKMGFFNVFLVEKIYVEKPDGFSIQLKEDQVYLLKNDLYGLK